MFQQSVFDPHRGLLDMTQSTIQSDLGRLKDDEFDSKSGSENLEGLSADEETANHRKRKKRYHRHTQHQIQEMEAFFKECPHPDDKQRKELGKELGLEPLQVKFWFQNKRTQVKTQTERHENQQLRMENEKLRAENMRYKEALASASCPTCGGPINIGDMSFDDSPLRLENIRLREEIDRITSIAARYAGKPMMPYPGMAPQLPHRPLDLMMGNYGMQQGMGGEIYGVSGIENHRQASGTSEADRPMVIELAVAGMEELVRMAQIGEPLWIQGPDNTFEILSEEEYSRMFPRGGSSRPLGLKSEASRETAVVIMNPINLVELLMDVQEWSAVFSSIVSRATTLDVLSTGVAGNYNGALQVMTAEFQVASPLVPTRESFFVRYCKQHSDNTWAVVDVSLDHLRNSSPMRCRRLPSGCLIQVLPNGYSKVVWVEHVEADDRAVHNLYKGLVNSTLGFGAKRWVSTLDRQSERLASLMVTTMPPGESVITSIEGRKGMLKLAQRMVMSFCAGVSASTAHTWTTLSGSGAEDVRVMTRKSIDDPGRPPGIVLSAATSFWLPIPPKRIFDFLRNEHNRPQWDVLSSGGDIQEVAHIANGRDPGNCVSLLRVNASNPSQSNMLIIQESATDATGSFVVYAPVDIIAMNMVLNGGDPDYVALLPSGFAVLPDGTTMKQPGNGEGEAESGGSLLTVAFQILVDSAPTAKLSLGSVATVNNLIACTVDKVKSSFERANT